jgi:hypothetical protein
MNLIYKHICGSTLYGLNIEGKSDLDKRSVFLCDINNLLGFRNNYIEQINIDCNDHTTYEFGRFIELLTKSNPNIVESLFVPEDKMIIHPHKILEPIFANRDKFLTKELAKILTQYAHSQIQKARGLNKMIVNPVEDGKDILDFCYALVDGKTIPLKKFMKDNNLKQEDCGLAKIPNCAGIYNMYKSNNNGEEISI